VIALDTVVLAAIVVVWTSLLLGSVRGVRRTPVVRPVLERVTTGVTAFMPARNEGEVIAQAADGVLVQDGLTKLVAIDDGSTDDTRARLDERASDRLVVLTGVGPGEGECGKPAALAFAYGEIAPDSPWLLFVDADVILAPGALAGMLAYARESGADLVTLLPRLTMATPIEKIVMPSIGAAIVAVHPPAKVMDPSSNKAFANGQVILIRRELYEKVDGHRAVIRDILEDVRLAELAKAAGGRLAVCDGRTVARTRMYDGWRELREGWTKNLFLLMGQSVGRTLALAIFGVVAGLLGWVGLAVGGVPYGVLVLAYVTGVQMLLRYLGSASVGWALLAPVGALVTAFLMLESMWRHRWGRALAWKGRDVSR
jgi:cellulose synthase/poly-beta-1,6-N-acetylglucosamine synthase-like glycosyltransferase